ncbi:MAG: alpha/beta hydrolase [Opitutus sp.]
MSAYRVMTRWSLFPGDRFTNLRKLLRVSCPVLLNHDCDDRMIPWYHGESLYEAARNLRKLKYRIDFGGHNDLPRWRGDRYRETLVEFAKQL